MNFPCAVQSGLPAKSFAIGKAKHTVEIGFVPMTDCAPLIAAKELGIFRRFGLEVKLTAEAGWATIREKIRHGELQLAHAHASMVFELSWGLSGNKTSCLTGLMLSHNGSALSLSEELWNLGVRDARSFKKVITRFKGYRKFRLAVVLKFSTQNFLLRRWLLNGGIDPDLEVELVVVPTPQVFNCLKDGHIDGYCAGEPWGSVGILEGYSWCVALTEEIELMHPEKVLLARADFEKLRHDEHIALIAALIEAAEYCDKPANRKELAAMLANAKYFDVPENTLLNALQGPFQRGMGMQSSALDAIVFSRNGASQPTEGKARWILNEINRHRLADIPIEISPMEISEIFQMNLYDEARHLSDPV